MVKLLRSMLPGANKDVKGEFYRLHGKVDVVLGMASRSLHCRDRYEAGDLRLQRGC